MPWTGSRCSASSFLEMEKVGRCPQDALLGLLHLLRLKEGMHLGVKRAHKLSLGFYPFPELSPLEKHPGSAVLIILMCQTPSLGGTGRATSTGDPESQDGAEQQPRTATSAGHGTVTLVLSFTALQHTFSQQTKPFKCHSGSIQLDLTTMSDQGFAKRVISMCLHCH